MSFVLILIASLTGSVHCVAMCGGFTAMAAGTPHPLRSQSLYHAGRLLTYLLLGTLAGAIGSTIDHAGSQFGFTYVATVATSLLLIAAGIVGLFRGHAVTISLFPHSAGALARRLLARVKAFPAIFPLALGLFSTLLPCGWLYTYLIMAAGTSSPTRAAAVMAAFWIGTLPLLAVTGGLSTIIAMPLRKHMPTLASLLMLLAGTYSLVTHLSITVDGNTDDHSCAMHSDDMRSGAMPSDQETDR